MSAKHVQELEMVARHRLKLLICVLNDGRADWG
jgi:thiamine pyrophosphate-dependent acetolactate synthase large subunit-like protein